MNYKHRKIDVCGPATPIFKTLQEHNLDPYKEQSVTNHSY